MLGGERAESAEDGVEPLVGAASSTRAESTRKGRLRRDVARIVMAGRGGFLARRVMFALLMHWLRGTRMGKAGVGLVLSMSAA